MDKNESIEHVLDNMDKQIVYKTKSSHLKAFLLVAIGIASFVIHSVFVWDTNSIFPPLLMMVGAISIIVTVFMTAFKKSHYVSAENHQKLKNAEIYFQIGERNKLLKLLETGNLDEMKTLKQSVSGGLRLRLMASKDLKLCFSQVIAYETNEYVTINAVKQHSLSEAIVLTEYFQAK